MSQLLQVIIRNSCKPIDIRYIDNLIINCGVPTGNNSMTISSRYFGNNCIILLHDTVIFHIKNIILYYTHHMHFTTIYELNFYSVYNKKSIDAVRYYLYKIIVFYRLFKNTSHYQHKSSNFNSPYWRMLLLNRFSY